VVKADVAELADARDLKSPSALDAIGASRLTAVNAMVPSPPRAFRREHPALRQRANLRISRGAPADPGQIGDRR